MGLRPDGSGKRLLWGRSSGRLRGALSAYRDTLSGDSADSLSQWAGLMRRNVKNDDMGKRNSAKMRRLCEKQTIKKGRVLQNAPRCQFVAAAFQSQSLSSNTRGITQAVRMASHQRLCSDCAWKRKKPHQPQRRLVYLFRGSFASATANFYRAHAHDVLAGIARARRQPVPVPSVLAQLPEQCAPQVGSNVTSSMSPRPWRRSSIEAIKSSETLKCQQSFCVVMPGRASISARSACSVS